jgi:MFS family permease
MQRARDVLLTFRRLARNRDLVRLQLAFAGSSLGQWAGSITVSVYAFERGGAGAVGAQFAARMLPGALFAPFAGALADRFPRTRVMVASDVVRVVAVAAMVVVVALSGPLAALFALVAVTGLAGAAFEPAKSAVTPSLARTPEELTAANVISSSIDGVAIFAGPALGGLLLAATSPQAVLVVTAATLVWSALLVWRIARSEQPPRPATGEADGIGRRVVAGLKLVVSDGRLRLVVGLTTAQTFVAGVLGVLLVATAFDLLHMGRAGPGVLNSAIGVGGIAGVAVAAALVAGRRLALPFAAGIVLWGLPVALIGAAPAVLPALALLFLVGLGNTLVDVAGLTLLQRSAPEDALGRVFGVFETLILSSIALGAALAPALVAGLGIEGALAVTGVLLPALAVVCWRPLARLDRAVAADVPVGDLELLRGVPMLRLLDEATLERLAGALQPSSVAAGEAIVRQGELADRFFLVVRGRVEVVVDGRRVREHGAGESFGEIGLLRATTRTATVRALEPAELRSLPGDAFVAAVTGHAASAAAADSLVATRLGSARPAAMAL